MTTPLSQELRKKLLQEVEEGHSIREVAARNQVNASTVFKLLRRVRETGSTVPAKIGGYRKSRLLEQDDFLRTLVASSDGITLARIRDALAQRGLTPVSLTTIWSTLRRLGLEHKKKSQPRRR